MNEEDLVKEFMELSLYDLEYIIGVEIDNLKEFDRYGDFMAPLSANA